MERQRRRRIRPRAVPLLAALAVVIGFVLTVTVGDAGGAASDQPVTVTPYGGAGTDYGILARAPYVTDLGQTSAYVNWATTSSTPGSLQVAPEVNGGCPASVQTWSSQSDPVAVPTSLPGAVNETPGSSDSTMTGSSYSVADGSGTTTTEYQVSVPVSGLSPSTRYCYSVFSTDQAGATNLLPSSEPDQTFTTLDPVDTTSTKPVTFDVIGDTGENFEYTGADAIVPFPGLLNQGQAAVDSQIGQSGAQFLLQAGDVSYTDGTASSYGDLEHSAATDGMVGSPNEVSNIFGPDYFPLTGGIPTFTADGNHGQHADALRIWPTPVTTAASGGTYAFDTYGTNSSNSVDGISGTYPDDWYAFSTGNVRIYVLDASWSDGNASSLGDVTGSECGTPSSCLGYQADYDEHWQTTSPEYQWLQHDLASHPGGVKFAVFHYPFQSDNPTQPTDPYLDDTPANPNASTSLEALLSNYGVDIAFNGHTHTYQRFIPDQPGQLINYVTGGGGGVLVPVLGGSTCAGYESTSSVYAIGWTPSRTVPDSGSPSVCGQTVPAASTISAADVFSFLKVTVAGDQVTVTPTNAAGQTFDSQTYQFQPSAPGAVQATATSPSEVHLTWSPSSETGGVIASYRIDRNGSPLATVSGSATQYVDTSAQPSTQYTYSVSAEDNAGTESSSGTSGPLTTPASSTPVRSDCMTHLPSGSVVGSTALADGSGYYEVDRAGDVAAFGNAPCYGAMSGTPLNKPIVGMAVDPSTGGYWLVASDGGIFAFGGAPFYGSTGGIHLNMPIVGLSASTGGSGYWLVASDGGIFAFGGAPFYGSTGNIHLNKPIVGMAVDPSTGGYWLVAKDGGIFSFHAPFYGSTGNIALNQPIVGMAPVGTGVGYRLIASDGGVFSFDAPFYGSTGNIALNQPIIAGVDDPVGDGYWLIASDGGVFSFDAPFLGSAA